MRRVLLVVGFVQPSVSGQPTSSVNKLFVSNITHTHVVHLSTITYSESLNYSSHSSHLDKILLVT